MPVTKIVYAKDWAPIDIHIDKNRDSSEFYGWEDENGSAIDMSTYGIAAELRTEETDGSTLIATFAIDRTNDNIGEITLSLTQAITNAINYEKGFYDIKVTDNAGITKSWVKGKVSIGGTVTA